MEERERAEIERPGDDVSIADEAARIRAALLQEGRSVTMVNLFDYLLSRVGDARSPKEIEVAMAVFGKSGGFDTSQNSTVRSHVHRLRQRLDKYNTGQTGPRLCVPKGEYRLVLIKPDEVDEPQPEQPEEEPGRLVSVGTVRRVLIAAFAVSALFWIAMLAGWEAPPQKSAMAQTKLWNPIVSGSKPPVIAVGDLFFYGTSDEEGVLERLSTKSDLKSGEELTRYLIQNPDEKGFFYDRDIYRVPDAEATVAMEMLKLLSGLTKGPVPIVPISRMSQEQMDSGNIVYIQYFSQLSSLRSPIVNLSGFAPTADFEVIRDKVTGTQYAARSANAQAPGSTAPAGVGAEGVDYGYIARFPGPSDNRNLLVSGIGDEALQQMAKLVQSRQQLDELARRAGDNSEFEALYRVRTMGGLVYETQLLTVRPLQKNRP